MPRPCRPQTLSARPQTRRLGAPRSFCVRGERGAADWAAGTGAVNGGLLIYFLMVIRLCGWGCPFTFRSRRAGDPAAEGGRRERGGPGPEPGGSPEGSGRGTRRGQGRRRRRARRAEPSRAGCFRGPRTLNHWEHHLKLPVWAPHTPTPKADSVLASFRALGHAKWKRTPDLGPRRESSLSAPAPAPSRSPNCEWRRGAGPRGPQELGAWQSTPGRGAGWPSELR